MDHHDIRQTAAPVLCTRDDLLVAEVSRLAAASGVVPEVVRDPAAALSPWASAPVILVGADIVGDVGRTAPPRRAGVHVLVLGEAVDALFRDALHVGAERVLALPEAETWLVERLTDIGDGDALAGRLVGVVGGSGGAGATVLTGALAHAAAAHAPALAVDADVCGAGLDRVLGMESSPGVRWDALTRATGRLSARSLREALPRKAGLSVLSWSPGERAPLDPAAVREVLSASVRGFPWVFCDIPRHPDPVLDETLSRCERVVLITRLTVPAITAACQVAARLSRLSRQVALVTRGSTAAVDPDAAASLLGVPMLTHMPDQRGLDAAVDLGAGPLISRRGALTRATRVCLAGLTDREAA